MRFATFTIPLLLLLASCGQKKPVAPAGPARAVVSTSGEREALSLTVYNQNFAVVREKRRVATGVGRVELSYADVAEGLQAETVHLTSTGDAEDLTVLEQNYRYDLLSPETLLEKYVGKTIKVYRYNEKLGQDEVKTAEVLARQDGVVLRIDGELTTGQQGRYAFPKIPENLVEKPTLVWLLDSAEPKQSLEVTYLTRDVNWTADYVLVLAADDKSADLNGWVSLTNESGMSYDDVELKLVAGDVQRVLPPQPMPIKQSVAMSRAANAAPQQFTSQGLLEYHLYTLGRKTSVKDHEKKQVSLLEAHGVGVNKRLVLEGQQHYFGPGDIGVGKQPIGVWVEFQNAEKNRLGQPLPKGVMRVYKADQGGAQQFVGESEIDHTPRDEKVKVKVGQAFDVVADRKRLNFTQIGNCVTESNWEILLKNHKDAAESVEVREPTAGDFEITASSHPPKKESSSKFTFDVAVAARGETKLTYTIRVRWC